MRIPERLGKLLPPAIMTASVILLAISFWFRFRYVDAVSYWYDEIFTIQKAQLPVRDILLENYHEFSATPPLHFIIYHYWIKLAGISELSTKLFSSLVVTLSLWPFFLLVRNLTGRRSVALAVTAVYSVSWMTMWASLMGRYYALVSLFAILACLQFLESVRVRQYTIPLVAVLALGMLTHYAFFLLFAAMAVTLAAVSGWRNFRSYWPVLLAPIPTIAHMAIRLTPLHPQSTIPGITLFERLLSVSRVTISAPPMTPEILLGYLLYVPEYPLYAYAVAALLIVCAAYVIHRLPEQNRHFLAATAIAGILPLIPPISRFFPNIYYFNYFAPLFFAACGTLTYRLIRIARPFPVILGMLLFVSVSVHNLTYLSRFPYRFQLADDNRAINEYLLPYYHSHAIRIGPFLMDRVLAFLREQSRSDDYLLQLPDPQGIVYVGNKSDTGFWQGAGAEISLKSLKLREESEYHNDILVRRYSFR